MLAEQFLVSVAVAAGLGANMQGTGDFGDQRFVVGDESGDALAFGAYSQQRLLEFQIQRNFGRYLEGQRGRILGRGLRIFFSAQSQKLFMKVEKLLSGLTVGITPFIIKVADLGAQKGALP